VSTTSERTLGRATALRLDRPDQPIAAVASGPDTGPPVLLVPGFTGSKEDFGPILDPLGAAGFRAVAIDLPGQFESPGPADPAAYRPERLGPVVCAVAARLGGGVRLLGHSYGGLVARAAVLADAAPFTSLVLLGSGPAALGGARRERIERLEPLLATTELPELYAAVLAAERAVPGYTAPDPETAAFLERRFVSGARAMLAGMGEALRTEPDRVAELAAVDLPTLVACGAQDDAWPPALQRDMAARLRAPFAVIPDAAHSPAVENPAATVDVLLRFWR
jgi:pimeloyl-ACP methyl ester carboxylesterase